MSTPWCINFKQNWFLAFKNNSFKVTIVNNYNIRFGACRTGRTCRPTRTGRTGATTGTGLGWLLLLLLLFLLFAFQSFKDNVFSLFQCEVNKWFSISTPIVIGWGFLVVSEEFNCGESFDSVTCTCSLICSHVNCSNFNKALQGFCGLFPCWSHIFTMTTPFKKYKCKKRKILKFLKCLRHKYN